MLFRSAFSTLVGRILNKVNKTQNCTYISQKVRIFVTLSQGKCSFKKQATIF